MARFPTLHRNTALHHDKRHEHAANDALIEAITATAELCGKPVSDAAAKLLAKDLTDFPETAVMEALARCRMELHGPLNIGEILARLDDGRPDAEEAWDMMPLTEAASVVWTAEMAQAWGNALPHFQSGNWEQARDAFRKSYTQAVLLARCKRTPIHWTPSLGTDPAQRERVLLDAVKKERLAASYVQELLPYRSLSPQAQQLLSHVNIKNVR